MRCWRAVFLALFLLPSAAAAVTVGEIDVPERTMAEKPFAVNITLRNDGPARSVYLFGAIYREQAGAGPCGPASDARFGAFTQLIQETVRLPADSTTAYPGPDDAWLHRYRQEHVDAEPGTAEFCVFVANATSGPVIQYEAFATTQLFVRGVNAKPTAEFDWDPPNPVATRDVEFRAQGSDADGDPVSFSWDFGHLNASGRARASGASASTFFYPAGDFVVTLTASDGLEETRVSRTITVAAEAAPVDDAKRPFEVPLAPGIALVGLVLAGWLRRR